MEFFIVAEFGIIDTTCKTANCHAFCYSVVEISVYKPFAVGLFQIPESSDNHLF